jgi:hypothetical protein
METSPSPSATSSYVTFAKDQNALGPELAVGHLATASKDQDPAIAWSDSGRLVHILKGN